MNKELKDIEVLKEHIFALDEIQDLILEHIGMEAMHVEEKGEYWKLKKVNKNRNNTKLTYTTT